MISHLDSVSGISAAIDPQNGFVSIHADPGLQFDFSGRVDPIPIATGITGSSRPTFSGTYSGAENTTWNVDVITGGDIGVSEPVLLRVSDAVTGEILGDFDFGKGYARSLLIISLNMQNIRYFDNN